MANNTVVVEQNETELIILEPVTNLITAPAVWGTVTGDITDQTDLIGLLGDKVDKVTGKGLSEADITSAEKIAITHTNRTALDAVTNVNTGDETELSIKTKLGFTPENVSNKVTSFQVTPDDTNYPSEKLVKDSLDNKVDKITGKQLSTNDFTDDLETKLNGIEAGAEVNVNSDWNSTSGDSQILNKPTLLTNLSNGATTIPSITDNGNGTVTLGTADYCLSSVSSGNSLITKYTIAGATYSLTDNTTNYIVADYNGGTPIVKVITDVSSINETTIIPIYTIFRNGNYLHTQNWDSLGLALSNKVHQSIVKTQRYRRESGLALSEYGTRNLNLTGGIIWTGAVPITLDEIATATDNIYFYSHVAGVWTLSLTTAYNNTQYDNGTNLVTLTNNRYAVNWIFRGVESQKHLYVVLGTGDYTLQQATDAIVPAIPTVISSHAVLVGKVIVQKSATTATSIQSAFEASFSSATPSNHNDLTNRDVAGNHAKIIPLTDSTTAIQITKADGATSVMNVDTTNSRVGIGTATAGSTLSVNGIITASGRIGITNTLASPFATPARTMFMGMESNYSRIDAYDYGTSASIPLCLQTSTTAGLVGIGTTTPRTKLEMLDGAFTLSDTDVVHGMANIYHQNTYGSFSVNSATGGGLVVSGVSDADYEGIVIIGNIGTETPNTTTPAIRLTGRKQLTSGNTTQNLADNETVLVIQNGASTRLATVVGNGNTAFGAGTPNSRLGVFKTPITTIPALGAPSEHLSIGVPQYGMMISTNSAGYGYIQQQRFDGTATAYNLLLQPNGGNVGIGTTTPVSKLTIKQDTDTITGGLSFMPTDVGVSGGIYRQSGTTGALVLRNNGIDTMYVKEGNIGIGTTAPTVKLEVAGVIKSTDTTASTSATSGSLITSGGLGVAKSINVGESITSTQYKLSALNTAPANSTATGTLGEVRITADYIYVCVATDTWKRTPISTW
jgi:hypothetical protein